MEKKQWQIVFGICWKENMKVNEGCYVRRNVALVKRKRSYWRKISYEKNMQFCICNIMGQKSKSQACKDFGEDIKKNF